MFNPWLGVAHDAAWLLFEAQWVVAARMTRMAAGGALAQTEVQRMVSEKTAAFLEAQILAAGALARGRKAPAAAHQVLRAYRRRVRGNRRRLLRPPSG
jgi:geranylgeranyl pyrophosphate synthase